MIPYSNSDAPDFEPSLETKEKWLSTRKLKRPVGQLILPGLFETIEYSQDKALFILAMILEVVGFLIISALAYWGVLIAGVVAVLVVVDVFLAIGVHWKQGEICRHENLAIAATGNQSQKDSAEREVKEMQNWWLGKVWIILLCVVAVIKASGFYVLNPDTYIYGILMFLVYAFIAYVHIRHTGYFLSEYRFRRAYHKERTRFAKWNLAGKPTDPKAKDTCIPDQCREYLLYPPSTCQLQELKNVKATDAKGKRADLVICDNSQWKLITWGLMDDQDLLKLLSGQGNVRDYLAVECVKAQLNMLKSHATTVTTTAPTLANIQVKIDSIQPPPIV